MSLVYNSSHIQALSRKKKKNGNANSDASKNRPCKTNQDEDDAFKGNNICDSLSLLNITINNARGI